MLSEHAVRTLTDPELARLAELVRLDTAARASVALVRAREASRPLPAPPGFGAAEASRRVVASHAKAEVWRGNPPCDTLFVEDIIRSLDDAGKEQLTGLLQAYGRLLKLATPLLNGRQAAFATYSTVEEAIKAKDALDGAAFLGGYLSVRYKAAKR